MVNNSKIGIVGAGIQGISNALFLQKKGFNVTLFDRDEPGSPAASYGNAGHFSPYASLSLNRTDGNAALLELKTSGSVRGYIGADATGSTVFYSNAAAERMRIDSSGNVGIGVTPSAWASGQGALQFKDGGLSAWSNGALNGYIYSNAYYDGTNNRYINIIHLIAF